MRILFLTPELPNPARGGGAIKTATVLTHLERSHEVDLLCLRGTALTHEQGGARSVGNLARSYAARVPLSILRNRSKRFGEAVQRQVAGRGYDAVFVDGWLMAQYLPPGFTRLKALHEHNAEFSMWEKQVAIESNPLRRLLVRAEARRVRRYERSILDDFDVVFAVSEADRLALTGLSSAAPRTELLPNVAEPGLLDRPALSPTAGDPVLLFLGTLGWPPNFQGLRLFIRETLPLIRQRLPGAKLLVGGRGAPEELRRMAEGTRGVELFGPFDDPEPLYGRARAFVEVARGGGGTRLKVLNAMARGLPVVTTADGAEGLEIRSGEDALVASSPAEFADLVAVISTDDEAWSRVATNGRSLIRRLYVPEVAYAILDEVFAPTPRR